MIHPLPPTRIATRPAGVAWYEQPESRLGSLITASLRLTRVLGKGGNAVTYLAVDEGAPVEREVVVKLLYLRPAEDALDKVRRFVLEGAALDRLSNEPGFVVQIERGERPARRPEDIDHARAEQVRQWLDNGWDYFLVLQYLSGGSLWSRIQPAGLGNTDEAVRLITATGRALARAHARGIVHRDVTPANILLDAEGNPKLSDFGLALFLAPDQPQVHTLPSYKPLGTPGYMPPESFRGLDTVQRDVYALGITLIETLVGPLAEPANRLDPASWRSVIAQALQRVQPPGLRAIAARAVAEAPAERYRTMAALVADLQAYRMPAAPVRPASSLQPGPGTRPAPAPRPAWRPGLSADLGPRVRRLAAAGARQAGGLARSLPRRLPLNQLPGALPRLSPATGQRLLLAGLVAVALRLLLTTWSDFYGPVFSQVAPILAGLITWRAPRLASGLAAGLAVPLFLSLSPVAGLAAAGLALLLGLRLLLLPPTRREDTLLAAWLIAAAPVLAGYNLASAVPIAIGLWRGRWRSGVLAGAATYLALSLWATLRGQTGLGSLMIWDPLGPRLPWVLDVPAATFFNLGRLTNYIHWTLQDLNRALELLHLLGQIWTASAAPALSLLVWSGAGGAAAWLRRGGPGLPNYSDWQIAFLTVAGLNAATWALAGLLALDGPANLVQIGLAVAVGMGVAGALTSLRRASTLGYFP